MTYNDPQDPTSGPSPYGDAPADLSSPTGRPTPSYWRLFAAAFCAGAASLVSGAVLVFVAVVLVLDDEVGDLGSFDVGDWAALAADLGLGLLAALAINTLVVALLLKLSTRIIAGVRVGYPRALGVTALASIAWFVGGVVDLLALGFSLGLVGALCFSAAAAWLLRADAGATAGR